MTSPDGIRISEAQKSCVQEHTCKVRKALVLGHSYYTGRRGRLCSNYCWLEVSQALPIKDSIESNVCTSGSQFALGRERTVDLKTANNMTKRILFSRSPDNVAAQWSFTCTFMSYLYLSCCASSFCVGSAFGSWGTRGTVLCADEPQFNSAPFCDFGLFLANPRCIISLLGGAEWGFADFSCCNSCLRIHVGLCLFGQMKLAFVQRNPRSPLKLENDIFLRKRYHRNYERKILATMQSVKKIFVFLLLGPAT